MARVQNRPGVKFGPSETGNGGDRISWAGKHRWSSGRSLIKKVFHGFQYKLGIALCVLLVFPGSVAAAEGPLARQWGELLALISLGGEAQKANSLPFAGTESRLDFGTDAQSHALVFIPPSSVTAKNTIVLFVHGGGWDMGTPEQYRFIGRFFAERGFPTILAGYRLAPRFVFPAQIEDAVASLRAGLSYFEEKGIHAQRLILGGHSAGAELASLIAYGPWLSDVERGRISGLFLMSGVLDFSMCTQGRISTLIDKYIGTPANREAADPMSYPHGGQGKAALLLHGAEDPLVDPANSLHFAQSLNGGPSPNAEVRLIARAHHTDTLNLFLRRTAETDILDRWLSGIEP